MKDHLVAALLHPPLAVFEFGCAVEIFGISRPELDVDWYEFKAGALVPGLVGSTIGLGILVEYGLELFERADTILVPSWGRKVTPPPEIVAALVAAHRRGARLLSICSGAFLLAAAGLLDGRRATTHWLYAEELARRFPKVTVEADMLYVDEGDVITAAGSAAGLDMLLHVVRRDHGARVCNLVARRLILPPHREGGQAQFIQRPVPLAEDSRLTRVIEWMRANTTENLRAEDLAEMAAMSPRTFFRKFRAATGMAPYDWLIQERLAIAKDLLEEDRLSIEQIATAAGFGAAETLRHHFRRLVGRSPAAYRRAFSAEGARDRQAA